MEEKHVIAGLEGNVKNLRTELKQYKSQAENFATLVDLRKKEIDARLALKEIAAKYNKRLDPKFEFEKRDDWLLLAGEIDRIAVDVKAYELRMEILKLEQVIDNSNIEIERISKALPEAEEKLRKAKGE